MIWRGFCPTPPLPPTLLASCEIEDSLPNQLLTVIATNLAQISAAGGIRVRYTVNSTGTQYTVHTFSWLLLSFAAESSASGPQTGRAPIPLPTTPSSSLNISLPLIAPQWEAKNGIANKPSYPGRLALKGTVQRDGSGPN